MIDGKRRPLGFIGRYELAPGVHAITFSIYVHGYSSSELTRTFRAAPGGVYVVDTTIDKDMKRWNVAIREKSSGQRVDGVNSH